MKKKFTFLMAALMLLTMMVLPGKAVGQTKATESYTFTNKYWNATNSSSAVANWTDYTAGDSFESADYARGIAKSKATINGTSPVVLSNVSSITVVASANQAGPTLTIYKVVDNEETSIYSASMTKENNKSYTVNLTGDNVFSGKIKVVLASSSSYKSVWIKSVSVTYTPTHTLTYSATNGSISGVVYNTSTPVASGASVAEGGKVTLTATPDEGYAFTSWEYSPTGTGAPTLVADGNTATFTMGTANSTVTANFEPASSDPIVSITPATLTGFNYVAGSVSPSNYQSFVVKGSNLSDGVTVTVDEGYTNNYAICKTADGTYGSSISLTESEVEAVAGVTIFVHLKAGLSAGNYNNNTITAKYNDDANVKATITVSGSVTPTHTLTISATNGVIKNGNVTMTTGSVAEGAEIEVTAVPNTGYVFTGWTVSGTGSSVESDTDNPTTFIMGSVDAVLTATFEVDPIVKTYLTGDDMESVTNAGTTYGNMKSVTTSDGFYWESNGYQYKNQNNPNDKLTNMLQLRKRDHDSGVSYIKLPEFNGKIESIVFLVTDAANSSTTYASGGACKATVCFQTGTTNNETPVTSAGNTSTGLKTITLDLSEKYYSTGYITLGSSSAGARFWNIEVNYIPYSNFTEWTPGDDFEAGGAYAVTTNINTTNLTIPATAGLVVKDDAKLTVTGTLTNNGTAANLIIEDGGQLICNNSVAATVQKTVAGWTGSKGDADGWYAIASPVNTVAITSFAQGNHNVYRYDEATHFWQEYHNWGGVVSEQTLDNGRGYLYRSTEPGIAFAGNTNVLKADYTLSYACNLDNMKGFNLIGNPFTHNIYKGATAAAISNTDDKAVAILENDAYYFDTAKGEWLLLADGTAIAPTQAILVQATKAATLSIVNSTAGASVGKYANDNIWFTVKNSEYHDDACVKFKEGHGLNKIEHRNDQAPMLYIMHNGENFASVDMDDNTNAINLGFEAKTMGQYTFSLKTEGQYSYMHLYDKITGEDIDMLVEDSYSFIGTPSDRKDRFVLNLNYNDNSSTNSETFAYQSGNEIIVRGDGELQIFDVMGRLVMNQRINGVETVNGINNGVYIFKLEEKTQKIVVR